MKHILPILFLAFTLNAKVVKLTWDYPENQRADIEAWNLYHSPTMDPPSWLLLGSYANNLTTNLIVLDIEPGQHFFYLTASNFWGESLPSEPARTPTLPLNINTLEIRR